MSEVDALMQFDKVIEDIHNTIISMLIYLSIHSIKIL